MCGIAGGWWKYPDQSLGKRIDQTLVRLRHRGPNDTGIENIPADIGEVNFLQTRLSIIDLSSAGHQPMYSSDKRYVIVFNGEIYNYKELRNELLRLGRSFATQSDTEVLLSSWQEWGQDCLKKLIGMFAFTVYDQHLQTITSVRDAFGIKPFFYSHDSQEYLFASEQPALLALCGRRPQINLQRSYDYLVYGNYDSNELTFIDGIKHLMPGHLVTFDIKNGHLSEPKCWWSQEITQNNHLSFQQATEIVQSHFLENIRLHLRSDVPLGAALSGGIDSSAVVCAMRYLEPDAPIHTFSFIAKGSKVSEEYWVNRVNQHVNSIPHKVFVTGNELANDLDDMIRAQGEPFGSTSIYAQYRVFKLAKESGITVTLDGQGADELLAGYIGYPGQRLLSLFETLRPIDAITFANRWSCWPGRHYLQPWMYLAAILIPDRMLRFTRLLLGKNYRPGWLNIDLLLEAGVRLSQSRNSLSKKYKGRRVIEELGHSLTHNGLPALLRHGDRNSMRFSVESRVPFLTLPITKFLLSLPENYLISNSGETKNVFRAAMRGIVPDDILDRRDKIGFETPEREWLLGMSSTVREWLQASSQIPLLNSKILLKNYDDVVSGKMPFSWQVWRWINFVRWYEQMEIEL